MSFAACIDRRIQEGGRERHQRSRTPRFSHEHQSCFCPKPSISSGPNNSWAYAVRLHSTFQGRKRPSVPTESLLLWFPRPLNRELYSKRPGSTRKEEMRVSLSLSSPSQHNPRKIANFHVNIQVHSETVLIDSGADSILCPKKLLTSGVSTSKTLMDTL